MLSRSLTRCLPLGAVLVLLLAGGCKQKPVVRLTPAQVEAIRKKDDALIQAYLAAQHLTATRTASGLYYVSEQPAPAGAPAPVAGQTALVNYRGVLLDGTRDGEEFDASSKAGRPYKFRVGVTPPQVIAGWDEGVRLMHQGEHGRLIIPSQLAYGNQGYDPIIPENAVLIFYMALEAVE